MNDTATTTDTKKTRIETPIANLFPLAHELLTSSSSPPEYLLGATLNLHRILKKNIKLQTTTVSATGKWLARSNNTGDPYSIEFSELKALKEVFLNKISLTISPNSTTQEKFVINAIEMINQVISNESNNEPILLITRSSQSLNIILENIITFIPNLIHCGSTEECTDDLRERNIDRLLQKSSLDDLLSEIKTSIKKLEMYMELLKATKVTAVSDDSFVNNAPQSIRGQFKVESINLLPAWLNGNNPQEALSNIANASDSANIDKQLLPQFILDDINDNIREMWEKHLTKLNKIWNLPLSIRKEIRKSHDEIITNHLHKEINETSHAIATLKDSIEEIENIYNIKWHKTVKSSPLIGMDISCASQHRNFIEKFEPRVIIVNEASLIPEESLIPFLSSHNLEHLILVGEKKSIKNDISLFEHLVRQGAPHQIINLPRKSSNPSSTPHKNLHQSNNDPADKLESSNSSSAPHKSLHHSDNDPVDKLHTESPPPQPQPNNDTLNVNIIQDPISSSATPNNNYKSNSVNPWNTAKLVNSAWWLSK
ncbi:432_t:CDS:2 [Ambispora gerdemannii]|uniref:432_t:CDS:1 n=1 Tax=Ambispora gerdemannii TaxID=144530 RepID=A0A9N8ZTS3_9GLOM|nr:432_t:CDS:2 [Ambispora gerdemannii]